MTIKAQSAREDLCHEILSYLVMHPRSEDSIEGIVEWWLLQHYVARTRTAVRAALKDLVGRGFILERKGIDGMARFRLNPRKRGTALRLVGKAS